MRRIELDHWFVKGNMFSISLMNFYVDINYNRDTDDFILRVFDSNRDVFYYLFDNFEDAIEFVEDVVKKAFKIEEIDLAYLGLKEVKKQIK